MKEQQLINWLKAQKDNLDTIIARAAEEFHEHNKKRPNFAFDLAQCQAEFYNLSRKPPQDLCYDRPNTPLVYSLWYHGRRVNTFLSHYARVFLDNEEKIVEIFDLGAGTGAVQWGIGLIYHFMKQQGLKVPQLQIVNVDTSPFMLHYSRHYLWKHFLQFYPNCRDFDSGTNQIEYHINAWANIQKLKITNAWITASYLFDISDTDASTNYKAEALEGFQQILKLYNPSRLLLLTAESKENVMREVAREFPTTDYVVKYLKANNLILEGPLNRVNDLRHYFFRTYEGNLNTDQEKSINRNAAWDDHSFASVYVAKKQQQIFETSNYNGSLHLHNVPVKQRDKVELNTDQQRAARNVDQATVIIGPAGCGKSIVLTERIKNIVEAEEYNPNVEILVTTFNTELLRQLAVWVAGILSPGKFKYWFDEAHKGCSSFFFNNTKKPNIRFINFDMLPRILGNFRDGGLVDHNFHKEILQSKISEVKIHRGIKDQTFDDILHVDFLLEEYRRVIYGLQTGIKNAENYLSVSRKGRGTKLERNKRELVWECLQKYGNHIASNRIPCFTARRQAFLDKLKMEELPISFDYIAVDEFQDCTKADFEIFFRMLKDPNNLVISGDLAQSVQLGRSANIELIREAIREGRSMRDISWHYLSGSYRLPLRICEAVKYISQHIHLSYKKNRAASVLIPYKGAPPGARPIIVYGKNTKEVADKIREIFQQYSCFSIGEISILEKDKALEKELYPIGSDTVLRLKGLEKNCVIWSTRSGIGVRREMFEFVHTILSRTSSLLIIALFENNNPEYSTQEMFKKAIGLLRRDRLIFWDKVSKEHFDAFCEVPTVQDGEDDE